MRHIILYIGLYYYIYLLYMWFEEKDTNPESVEVLDFQAILNSKIFLKKLEKMLDFIICYMLL